MSIVVKFGGSSVADAKQMRKVKAILEADPERRYLVVSAPGKRDKKDNKVTDLLYLLYDAAMSKQDCTPLLQVIRKRYQDMIDELNINFDLNYEMHCIELSLKAPNQAYLASRGEHICARMTAAYLHWPYVEAADHIFFDKDGKFLPTKSYASLAEALNCLDHAVIPGFYGSDGMHHIYLFSRGGSDLTGAICARAVHAEIYENWTDVNGMLTADPRIIEHPLPIRLVSYQELRELSYMGASVLHEETIFPVRQLHIPINIRNTNDPEDPGTMIVADYQNRKAIHQITGIAGKKSMSNIQIDKAMMNTEIGFGAKVLTILAKYHVPYEHTPTSIDTMSVLVATDQLKNVREQILADIQGELHPDRVFIEDHIAIVAIVGEGMAKHKGVAADILSAVAAANINVRMIDVSFSELNMILAVDEENYEKTIHAIYEEIGDRFTR